MTLRTRPLGERERMGIVEVERLCATAGEAEL